MPKGLKIPVGVDERGRAAVETDEAENTKKLLILALQEGGDNNPFQTLGLDRRLIFSTKTASFQGKAIRAVRQILNKYSQLVKLDESEPITFTDEGEGQMAIQFYYIDLLTGKRDQLKSRLIR